MTIKKVKCDEILNDVLIIEPNIFEDFRGEYIETFNKQEYEQFIPKLKTFEFVQDNASFSQYGTLRGLHGDGNTWKLIQCLYGKIFIAIICADPDSKDYLKHTEITLTDKTRNQILIPPKYANGHICLSDSCIFSYKQSTYYEDQKQFTIRWNSKRFSIKWPIDPILLSKRDQFGPFADLPLLGENTDDSKGQWYF